jgi:outer membrane lipopolysaccharide assembly protein LptE/RlpB
MKKLTSVAVLSILVCSFLVGCGWHLRSSETAQMLGNIEQVYVSGDESSLLYRSIIKSLKLSNVGIADTSATAGIIITLINQRSKSRTATVSSSARVSELQIIELVDIIISTGNGEILLPKTTLRREKFFTYNEDNVSTNNEENKMLKREMTKKLAKNIIRRLNATIKMINQNEPES